MRARMAGVLAAVVALVVAGCSSGDDLPSNRTGDVDGRPLVIASTRAVNTADPTDLSQAWQVSYGVGETLMTMSPGGDPVPGLLESLTNRTPTTWALTLRPGIRFQDGDPLTADKLARFLTYQSARSPLARAQLPGLRAAVTGERTVTITTPAPDSVVPRKLVQPNAFVVYDVDAVLAAGDDEGRLAASGYMTGPFRIGRITPQETTLVRNDTYRQGRPPLPGIRVLNIPDEQARLAAVRAGEADWAEQMSVEFGPLLRDDPSASYLQASWPSAIRLELDQASFPLASVDVRRAFARAIDYREIAQDVMGGFMETAQGMFPLQFPGALANQRTDPAEANRILDVAGWVRGPDGVRTRDGRRLEFTLLATGSRADHVAIALAVKQQVAAAGIGVVVRQVENVGDEALQSTGWGAAVVSNGTLSQWSASYETQLVRYHLSDSVQNYGHTKDPELDRLSADLIAEFDPARKRALLDRLQRLMIEEKAYLIVVAQQRPSLVVSPAYRGYVLSNWFENVRWDTAPAP